MALKEIDHIQISQEVAVGHLTDAGIVTADKTVATVPPSFPDFSESYRFLTPAQEEAQFAALPKPGEPFIPPPFALEHVDSHWVRRDGTPRYIEPELIQEGGQAKVYKAFDTELERYVAIKTKNQYSYDMSVEDNGIQREALDALEAEAKVMARLRSNPHTMKVYDFFIQEFEPETVNGRVKHQKTAVMVMEYLDPDETTNLRDVLNREKHLPLSRVARILESATEGLDSFAAQGVMHRDVKPTNLYLDNGDMVIFGDFGISSPVAELVGDTIRFMAAPFYAPVESYDDESNRRDLFSLAMVTYELMTGELPFSLINREPDPLSKHKSMKQYDETILAQFDRFFTTALAENPQVRFRSGQEMAEAFAKVVALTREPEPEIPEEDLQ